MGMLFSLLPGLATASESDDERIPDSYAGASSRCLPAVLRLAVFLASPPAAHMFGYLAVSVLCLLLFGLSRHIFTLT
jgi:hypothetical protein